MSFAYFFCCFTSLQIVVHGHGLDQIDHREVDIEITHKKTGTGSNEKEAITIRETRRTEAEKEQQDHDHHEYGTSINDL